MIGATVWIPVLPIEQLTKFALSLQPLCLLPLQSEILPCFHLVLLATIRTNTRIAVGGRYAEKVDHHA